MLVDIQSVIKSISTFNVDRRYWFFRTMGGDYYNEFVRGGFVAIGYDEVKAVDLAKAKAGDHSARQMLAEIVSDRYPKEKRPSYISNQLWDFGHSIVKGDIVIIPSQFSDCLAIGEVLETSIEELTEMPTNPEACPFLKRKRIQWLKEGVLFSAIDTKLIHLKYTRRTVTSIAPYEAGLIDRIIKPLYIKGDTTHLSIRINQQHDFEAVELFQTWLNLFNLAEDFGAANDIQIDKNDYKVRINVQSPGIIEFISYSVVGIVVLNILIATFIGAEFESNTRIFKLTFKSDGLMKSITTFLNDKLDRKMKEQLLKKVTKMQIVSDDVVNLWAQINRKDK